MPGIPSMQRNVHTTVHDYLRIGFHRKRWIMLSMIGCILGSVFYAYRMQTDQ